MSGSFSSLADLVQHFESSGNYSAQNATTTASGAYQFTTPTWLQYANQIGVNTLAYPTAASAPAAVQDSVFQQAVSQRGLADWTCDKCDPALVSYLASNPGAASLPAGGGLSGSSGGVPNYASPSNTLGGYGFDPSTGANTIPVAPGQTGASAATPTPSTGNLVSQATAWLGSVASRAGLFIVAIVFMLGAFALFALKSGGTHDG